MHRVATPYTPVPASRWPRWAAPLVLFVAVCAIFAINLERPLSHDELYHVMAAEGMLATGEPRILDGLYARGWITTWLVAQSFSILGASASAARLVAILPMAATVIVLFLWLRQTAGPSAAWIASVLFAISPFAIDTAQYVRFYSLQALCFVSGAVLISVAGSQSLLRAVVVVVAGSALLAFAVYLNPTALMGVAGVALWAGGAVAAGWQERRQLARRTALLIILAISAFGLLALSVAVGSGVLDELLIRYREVQAFNEANADRFYFYHVWSLLFYPTLWPLTGILSLVALVHRPQPAWLAMTVFVVAFLLASFAAAKATRYLIYAYPFLFALWGIGLAGILVPVGRWLERLTADLGDRLSGFGGRPVAVGLMAGAALFALASNPAWLRSATILADISLPPGYPREDWAAARGALVEPLDEVDVVVSTNELAALYYLGRAEASFSRSKLLELATERLPEFTPDPRTSGTLVSTPGGLETLIDCSGSGLFIAPLSHWQQDAKLEPDVRRLLLSRTQEVELPPRTGLIAFYWRHQSVASESCPRLSPRPYGLLD
jgi:hypothetical protein